MKRLALLFLTLTLVPFFGAQSSALSCVPDTSSLEENLAKRDYVFLAKMNSATEKDLNNIRVYSLEIIETYRGNTTGRVNLKDNMWDGYELNQDQEYLFLLTDSQFDSPSRTFTRQLCDYKDYFASGGSQYSEYQTLLAATPHLPNNESKTKPWLTIGSVAGGSIALASIVYLLRRKSLKNR